MGKCKICGERGRHISAELEVCLRCIRERPEEAKGVAKRVHEKSRISFDLPLEPPKEKNGLSCKLCVNECVIGEGERGYCGVRKNEAQTFVPAFDMGNLYFYYDPLPTNCVADWVCPGGTGAGYPLYAHLNGPEYGYKNLAIFFHACSFNCLFCQNWHFKKRTIKGEVYKERDLERLLDEATSCICFFGGDPSCQMPFALSFSRFALERKKSRILRICFETNGSMNEALLDEAFELSLISGGCIKFDLKAFDRNLHRILTGVENDRTLRNFERCAEKIEKRPYPPPLIASTLLVPGYIDEEEISRIAGFIARLNPDIPYALLAFYPQFYMADMPLTSKDMALRCFEAAKDQGLKNVRIGNIHLLR